MSITWACSRRVLMAFSIWLRPRFLRILIVAARLIASALVQVGLRNGLPSLMNLCSSGKIRAIDNVRSRCDERRISST
ncbi:hypothetical protein F5146DRAFT_1067361 [Armillaria mellea]|nr:hypothetical protein F5146DRAFT_1067361 [Armillaria mellea]